MGSTMKLKLKSFVRKNPFISSRKLRSTRRISPSKEETLSESSIDKAFRIQDFYDYKVSQEQQKEKKVNVNRQPNGETKYEMLPYLIPSSNVANILTVRRSVHKLVTKYNWDWADVMEQLLDDKNYIHAFTQLIKDISHLENPFKEQINYISNIERRYLHDNNEMEPAKFYQLMIEVNELLPWIDPTVNYGNQLSEEELWTSFLQAQNPELSAEAKEQWIENDKEKCFEFLKSQWKYDFLYASLSSCALVAQNPELSAEAKEQGIKNEKEKCFEFLKSQ